MPTILIVDDSATNRAIYSRLAVSLHGEAEVCAFTDPVRALDWLGARTADLIITDYKMPMMDGADFTRRIRDQPANFDVPIIVVTAYNDQAFRMEALEAGATDFLLTPVDHYEFVARGRNLLRLRSQQQLIKRHAEALEVRLERSEQAHEALVRGSRDALAEVIDTVPALISAAGRDGQCLFINEGLARFAGISPDDAARHDLVTLFGPSQGLTSQALNAVVFDTSEALPAREETLTDCHGEKRTFLTVRAPLRRAGRDVIGVLTTALDITDRKSAEDRLHHLAHHDTLTGLPNRTLLGSQLRHALARGRRGDRLFALHFIDLDRFKAINDGLGHHVGDQLLVAVGARLGETVRDGDTVARLGGDEFAIIQCDIAGPAEAAELAARVTRALGSPFHCDGHDLTIGASIGITVQPQDGGDEDTLLRNADLAMYRAKASGRSTWQFFAADMGPHAREAMRIEVELRTSLTRSEFVLHYQPQVELGTGRVVGVEALLRWQRPGHGLVHPSAFIALAEETGLIVPISTWVLREACQQAVRWRAGGLAPLRIGVNLSPVQFRRQDVFELVARTLAETGLDPQWLELELTESILMERAEETAAVLQRLRDVGVRLSVDDFGTGYSSLSYVKTFPLDRLKIDQSFVRGVCTDPNDTAIVRAILELGHTLRLDVVAEGVETEEQVTWLRQEGCEEAQGFFFSRPVPADEVAGLLRRGSMPQG